MPALPGIGEPERFAVLDDVGKDHHLGYARLLVGVRGDVDLQIAELPAEVAQLAPRQLLARKAQDAVLAERLEHAIEVGVCFLPLARAKDVLELARRLEGAEEERLKKLATGISLGEYIAIPRKS